MPRYEESPRHQDRPSPPLPPSVRDPYASTRDRVSRVKSPTDRRSGGMGRDGRSPSGSMGGMHRGPPPPRGDPYGDPYGSRPSPRPRESSSSSAAAQYKILCVSNLNHKVNDGGIRDALTREFGRFGDLSVKVVQDGNERLAYLYFRSYEDARAARHTKHRMILYDKELDIVPIYERPPPVSRRRSPTPPDEYSMSRHPMRGNSPSSHHHRSSGRSLQLPPPPPHHIPNRYQDSRTNHYGNNSSSGYHQQPPHLSAGGIPPHLAHSRYQPDPHGQHPPRNSYNNHHSSSRPLPPHIVAAQHHGAIPNPNPNQRPPVRESKKDKFPNYLHHIPPEDDDKSTRTLFVGNLEVSISDDQLRKIFEKFGSVDDIDVKRPPPGQGNAYAFIKFLNLDMANRAKVEMSGQYIGKFQCKIGYGKATPTTRIWIGGLGSWTSLPVLESEFDRFGAISKIDFVKGDNHAYVQYDTVDAATAAIQGMRGYPLGGEDKRLRVDYADPGPYSAQVGSGSPPQEGVENKNDKVDKTGNGSDYNPNGSWWNDNSTDSVNEKTVKPGMKRILSPDVNGNGNTNGSSSSKTRKVASESATSGDQNNNGNLNKSGELASASESVKSIAQLIDYLDAHNDGQCPNLTASFILKNSVFPSQLHFASGTASLVESLVLKNATVRIINESSIDSSQPTSDMPTFKITQRLRLDPSKLDDVNRRWQTSPYCVFVAGLGPVLAQKTVDSIKGENTGTEEGGAGDASAANSVAVNQRKLPQLVTYLKGKEAAGVIILQDEKGTNQGLLYAFPPCPFSVDLIRKVAPNIAADDFIASEQNYLVVLVVKN